MKYLKDGTSDHLTRVAVVSCDGMSRVGVYCSTFTSVEQVISRVFFWFGPFLISKHTVIYIPPKNFVKVIHNNFHFVFFQVYATQKVDIFNAVKCARNSRPQMVDSIAEYNYIHNTVKQFIVNITK